MAGETVTIIVQAGWLDHELAVWVHVAGARPLSVEDVIRDLRGRLRLPSHATRGVPQRGLERIVQALRQRTPAVLGGGQRALARVLKAGGEAT